MTSAKPCSLAAIAAAGLMICGGSALAQPAPPSSPAAAEAPVDPERLALAKRLIAAQSDQMNLPRLLRTIDTQVFDAVRKQVPNMDQARAERMSAAMQRVQEEMIPDMQARMAEGFARELTRQQLQDAVTFYESPSGRAVLHAAPAALSSTMAGLATWMPKMQAAVVDAACADSGCTPEQRRSLMGHGARPGAGPPPTGTAPPPRP